MAWDATIFTIFPEAFPGALGISLAGKALKKGLWSCRAINIRDYATDPHGTVDDTPFGGGAGMVMRPDIIDAALRVNPTDAPLLVMTPRGRLFDQAMTETLARGPGVRILCGRYEGIDQRVIEAHGATEISVGDYVLSGGEIAAQTVLDACVRLLPGVMGNADTAGEESFGNGLLEYPHYTRPAQWTAGNGTAYPVPDVLLSGHHAQIQQWRLAEAEQATRERRPDLWRRYIEHSGELGYNPPLIPKK